MPELRPLDLLTCFREAPTPLDFVLPGMVAGTVGLIVGMGSAGKSMLALQIGLSVAAGRDLFGVLGADPTPGRVVYLSAEDQAPILHHRLFGMAGAIPEDVRAIIAANFDVVPVYGLGISINAETVKGPTGESMRSPWGAVMTFCEGARLVICDTLIRFAGGRSENSNVEMSEMMGYVEITTRQTGAAFLMIHHIGKAVGRDGTGGSDQTATRGASALTDNARWQANLSVMTKEDGERRGYDGDARKRFVSFEITKQNYGQTIPQVWLERGDHGILRQGEPNEPQARGGRNNGEGRL